MPCILRSLQLGIYRLASCWLQTLGQEAAWYDRAKALDSGNSALAEMHTVALKPLGLSGAEILIRPRILSREVSEATFQSCRIAIGGLWVKAFAQEIPYPNFGQISNIITFPEPHNVGLIPKLAHPDR